jgi:hypothetical protein
MGGIAVEVALSIRAEHAEGPLWDAAMGTLTGRRRFLDFSDAQVHRYRGARP